jgi:dTDP-4-amino-4,6-dideoxygalactose transaminase
MSSRIPITQLVMGEAEAEAAAAVVRSGWLAMGAKTAELERAVATLVGARHAIAVSSGTAALHLALLASGVGPGDEVILPSLSYIATANAVLYVGAQPVFVDVDARTFNVDAVAIAAAITDRTRAIVPVHQIGLAVDLDPILAVARERALIVIEDGACALGASLHGRPVGGAPSAACVFSFHPRKVITTGEGGMIVTADAALAARLRLLRAQGASAAADARHASAELVFEEYCHLGYNYRLTDIQAAIGLAQLKRLPELLARRRVLAARYDERLATIAGIVTPLVPPGAAPTYQTYMVLLEGPWPRREVMEALHRRGIATRRAVMAIHLTPYYRQRFTPVPLPATEHIARRGLCLPLFPQLTDAQQDEVVAALHEACT